MPCARDGGGRSFALLLALCAACATPPTEPWQVRHWGTLREVLREGRSEGRVELASALGPHSVGLGLAAGLTAEITVDRGVAHLTQVVDAAVADGVRTRAPHPAEQAALLVCADVQRWAVQALPAARDLDALEAQLQERAHALGIDGGTPFPFRIEGRARLLELHVLDRSCPLAHPAGPPPWRFAGQGVDAVFVGFFAAEAEGELTHHGRRTHLHALLQDGAVGGHVDALALEEGSRLFLPAGGSSDRR